MLNASLTRTEENNYGVLSSNSQNYAKMKKNE